LGCAFAFALLASSASGAEPGALPPAIVPSGMTLAASHGFRVSIYGFDVDGAETIDASGPKEHDQALMLVEGSRSAVLYVTRRATVSSEAIEADFGRVGSVDVSWNPSGGTRTQRSPCKGSPARFVAGSYVGRIEFHGEEGFSAVTAGRARGDLKFLLGVVCSSPESESIGPGLHGADLTAKARLGTRSRIELHAVQSRPRAKVAVGATIAERPDPWLYALRATEVSMPPSVFGFSNDLDHATLSPGAPFSGRARFRRKASVPWSGDLSVDLPGRADVRLAGRQFNAKLRPASITHQSPHAKD
jgi:hypothetical protein